MRRAMAGGDARVLLPQVLKAVVAQYDAEQLLKEREQVPTSALPVPVCEEQEQPRRHASEASRQARGSGRAAMARPAG